MPVSPLETKVCELALASAFDRCVNLNSMFLTIAKSRLYQDFHDVCYYLLPLVIVIFYVVYFRFLSPLAKIPGPFSASLSRLWILRHSWKGDMHRIMVGLHKQHGKLIRTGPNEVSVSDLTAIKKIYGEHNCGSHKQSSYGVSQDADLPPGAGTKFKKSDWYSVWQGHRKFDLFAERNEGIHGSQRRLVSRIYSMDSLKDLEIYVDDAVSHFMTKMREMQGQNVNMGLWVQLFAFGTLRGT